MNDNLTPKQSEVYDYVKAAMREKGYCPTVREICLAVGLTSTSSVHAHLNTLERKGYIRRNPLKPRTIELMESAADQESDLLRIPIVGTVAAGMPPPWVRRVCLHAPGERRQYDQRRDIPRRQDHRGAMRYR